MLKIAICDDEKVERDYLNKILIEWNKDIEYIRLFESAESFLFDYVENKAYDILLLDIQMKEMDGIELAKKIRSQNEDIQIIFITGYSDFMAEGYEVSALHYLMKPVSKEKLFDVLDKALKNLNKTEKVILVDVEGISTRIKLNDIVSVEASGHKMIVNTSAEKYIVKKTIKEMQHILGDDFVRCHRSYIVGIKHIQKITKTDVILEDQIAIPLSRRLYNDVNDKFIKYYTGI